MAKIITVPNPILRKKSKAVTKVNRSVVDLIKALKKTLDKAEEPKGVGLSAVQIGKPVRIFLARQDPESEAQVFINPEITWESKKLTEGVPLVSEDGKHHPLDDRPLAEKTPTKGKRTEGCLSVPGYYGIVKRHKEIKLKWMTEAFDPSLRPEHSARAFGPSSCRGAHAEGLMPRGSCRGCGKQKTEKFSGFLATVIQHELDHLNGILFIDRVLEQGGKLYKVEEGKMVETSL